jgi:hypothetical protein
MTTDYSTQGLINAEARAWVLGAPQRQARAEAIGAARAARRLEMQPQLDALSARSDALLSAWDATESAAINSEIAALLNSVTAIK